MAPRPVRPLIDETLAVLGTKESYNIANESLPDLLQRLARDLKDGRVAPRFDTSSSATAVREFRQRSGQEVVVELDIHLHFLIDPEYSLGAMVADDVKVGAVEESGARSAGSSLVKR